MIRCESFTVITDPMLMSAGNAASADLSKRLNDFLAAVPGRRVVNVVPVRGPCFSQLLVFYEDPAVAMVEELKQLAKDKAAEHAHTLPQLPDAVVDAKVEMLAPVRHCVLIGQNAGGKLQTARFCVFLGDEAGSDLTSAEQLLIVRTGSGELRKTISVAEWVALDRALAGSRYTAAPAPLAAPQLEFYGYQVRGSQLLDADRLPLRHRADLVRGMTVLVPDPLGAGEFRVTVDDANGYGAGGRCGGADFTFDFQAGRGWCCGVIGSLKGIAEADFGEAKP